MFIDKEDYKVVIGDNAFKVISQADPKNVSIAEVEAIEEISSYLRPVVSLSA